MYYPPCPAFIFKLFWLQLMLHSLHLWNEKFQLLCSLSFVFAVQLNSKFGKTDVGLTWDRNYILPAKIYNWASTWTFFQIYFCRWKCEILTLSLKVSNWAAPGRDYLMIPKCDKISKFLVTVSLIFLWFFTTSKPCSYVYHVYDLIYWCTCLKWKYPDLNKFFYSVSLA